MRESHVLKLNRSKIAWISVTLHNYVKQRQKETDEHERALWEENAPEDRTGRPNTWRDLEQEGEWEASEVFWLDGEIQAAIMALGEGKKLKISWED